MDWNIILPALLSSGVSVALINYVLKKLEEKQKQQKEETDYIKKTLEVLKLANQASLRNSLRQKHEYAVKRGYATVDDKDDFEAMYNQYEALGENGVMTRCYEEYMALPTFKARKTKNQKVSA